MSPALLCTHAKAHETPLLTEELHPLALPLHAKSVRRPFRRPGSWSSATTGSSTRTSVASDPESVAAASWGHLGLPGTPVETQGMSMLLRDTSDHQQCTGVCVAFISFALSSLCSSHPDDLVHMQSISDVPLCASP